MRDNNIEDKVERKRGKREVYKRIRGGGKVLRQERESQSLQIFASPVPIRWDINDGELESPQERFQVPSLPQSRVVDQGHHPLLLFPRPLPLQLLLGLLLLGDKGER